MTRKRRKLLFAAGALITLHAPLFAIDVREALAQVKHRPVQQPTSFQLVINMKTVKALGLTIPPEVTVRVDGFVE